MFVCWDTHWPNGLELLALTWGISLPGAEGARGDRDLGGSSRAPTHDEVLKALDRLREVAAPEDFLCVSLSCHGFAADNGAYLVVQDTAPDFRDAVTDRELFADRLWKLNCPALVLLDACHSGSTHRRLAAWVEWIRSRPGDPRLVQASARIV